MLRGCETCATRVRAELEIVVFFVLERFVERRQDVGGEHRFDLLVGRRERRFVRDLSADALLGLVQELQRRA